MAAAKLLVDRYDPAPRHARVNLPRPLGDGLEGLQGAVALAAGALAAATRGEAGLDEALALIDGLRRLAELRDALTNEERMRRIDEKLALLQEMANGTPLERIPGWDKIRVSVPLAAVVPPPDGETMGGNG